MKRIFITAFLLLSLPANSWSDMGTSRFILSHNEQIREITRAFLKTQKRKELSDDTEIYSYEVNANTSDDKQLINLKSKEYSKNSLTIILAGKKWCNKSGCQLYSLYKEKDGKWVERFSTKSNGCLVISDAYAMNKEDWSTNIYVGDNFGTKSILFKNGKNKEIFEKYKNGESCKNSLIELEKFYN